MKRHAKQEKTKRAELTISIPLVMSNMAISLLLLLLSEAVMDVEVVDGLKTALGFSEFNHKE